MNQSSTLMRDRCLHLQDEVTVAFVDDFMVLPYAPIWRNVVEVLDGPAERHDAMFKFSH